MKPLYRIHSIVELKINEVSNYNFTVYPIDLNKIKGIHPLGQIGPPSHMFPTDHIYFELVNPNESISVYAPGNVTISTIRKCGENDFEVHMTFTSYLRGYYYHMTSINSSIFGDLSYNSFGEANVNIYVIEGTVIGTVGGQGMNGVCLDFGLYDNRVTLKGFIHPEFYGDMVHTVCPLDYYIEPLKTNLYDKLLWEGTGPKNGGRIDYDQPGKLIGTWFLKSWNVDLTQDWLIACRNVLTFVYDNINNSKIVVAIGGNLMNGESDMFYIQNNAPDPANISVSSGKIVYHLMDINNGLPLDKTLLVQLIDNDTLKVELFDGTYSAAELQFTSNAKIYDRGSRTSFNVGIENILLLLITLLIIIALDYVRRVIKVYNRLI